MRCLVQRVSFAAVSVEGAEIGRIGPGLCVLVGVAHDDDGDVARRAAEKVHHLRVLPDATGAMNLSLADTAGAALVVSQFTLYGDTSRGRRPSWVDAAPPEPAEPLVEAFVTRLRSLGTHVETGRFGAHMEVALVNDGPVTVMIEVNRRPSP